MDTSNILVLKKIPMIYVINVTKSIRAYASNGMSLGEAEDVDIKIESLKGQCKRRKRIAKWIKPSTQVNIQIVKEDRGEVFVIQNYEEWLEMVKSLQAH